VILVENFIFDDVVVVLVREVALEVAAAAVTTELDGRSDILILLDGGDGMVVGDDSRFIMGCHLQTCVHAFGVHKTKINDIRLDVVFFISTICIYEAYFHENKGGGDSESPEFIIHSLQPTAHNTKRSTRYSFSRLTPYLFVKRRFFLFQNQCNCSMVADLNTRVQAAQSEVRQKT
jgi:hypothetical protein